MYISLSELKANTGKYVDLADNQDVVITRNGKPAAKLVTARIDKKQSVKALVGILPDTVDYDALRKERILK
jgi:prevent-host-death family protein